MAQHQVPLAVGTQMEFSNSYMQPDHPDGGLGRISPFIALYIESLGMVKILYSGHKFTAIDSVGDDISNRFSAWTLQIGANLGSSGRPYFFSTYTRINIYSNEGDNSWDEWGAGLGGAWPVSTWISLLTEVEYRYQKDHTINNGKTSIENTHRIQFNLGMLFFFM